MNFLFRIVGFLPYLIVLFLNAFVDLGHKILIQNTIFKTYDGQTQIILTAIVNSLILLPFILMFTPAGFLSDKYPKSRVMKITAAGAVVLTLLITLFYYLGCFWLAFAMTFLLAVQSAIYSPAKFGYIRELVGIDSLAAANGLVQATTMIAILVSTFAFSILFEQRLAEYTQFDQSDILQAIAPIGWVLVGMSVLELFFALRLPKTQPTQEDKHFDWVKYRTAGYLKENLNVVYHHPVIWLSIIGLSIFWAISQVVLASFPAFAKETLGTINTVLIQGMMACAGIGVMIGSITSGRLSRGHIETGLLPIGAFGVAITLMLMPMIDHAGLHALNFLALGFSGGLFVVPLNALIQFHAKEHELGVVLASMNLVQTSTMLFFLFTTIVLAQLGLSAVGLISLLMIVAFGGAVYTLSHLPQSFARLLLGRTIHRQYQLEVLGFHHLPENGGVLMLGNHISFIDWAILQVACPRQIRFVMAKSYYNRWYLRWFLKLFSVIPIAPTASKEALRKVTEQLDQGHVVCLFPEGAISRNGQLGAFKSGFERAVQAAELPIPILPFHLRGLWGSRFSRATDAYRKRRKSSMKREIVVSFGEPLSSSADAAEVKQAVQTLAMQSWRAAAESAPDLITAWRDRPQRMAGQLAIKTAEKSNPLSLTHRQLLFVIRQTAKQFKNLHVDDRVLVIADDTPDLNKLIVQLALWMRGACTVMASVDQVLENYKEIKHLTQFSHVISMLESADERQQQLKQILSDSTTESLPSPQMSPLSTKQKILSYMMHLLPQRLYLAGCASRISSENIAAIFLKKDKQDQLLAVPLTHRNILINIRQLAQVLNTENDDHMLLNHSLNSAFGMTVTFLLPLIEGIPITVQRRADNPLQTARTIARDHITLLCAQAALFEGFTENEKINPLMLESLRLCMSNQAFLDHQHDHNITRLSDQFKLKFNKEVYVGFGLTEASPGISINVADKLDPNDFRVQTGHKPESVGLPLPGTLIRIIPETGEILISGPQLMSGYLGERGSEDDHEENRWFPTGLRGQIDDDGFLYFLT